jgi:hypothetical protein
MKTMSLKIPTSEAIELTSLPLFVRAYVDKHKWIGALRLFMLECARWYKGNTAKPNVFVLRHTSFRNLVYKYNCNTVKRETKKS